MRVVVDKVVGWNAALHAARMTMPADQHKPEWHGMQYPSSRWVSKMLFSEHSPIRRVRFWIEIHDVKRWCVDHLIRHKGGVEPYDTEPFVATQRSDRTGINRDDMPQGTPSIVSFDLNAQAVMSMARSRLCRNASPETREAWEAVKGKMGEIDPEMAAMMVPKCIHQGRCPEVKCCGWFGSPAGQDSYRGYSELLASTREVQP